MSRKEKGSRLLPHSEGGQREVRGKDGKEKGSENPPRFCWKARVGSGERGAAVENVQQKEGKSLQSRSQHEWFDFKNTGFDFCEQNSATAVGRIWKASPPPAPVMPTIGCREAWVPCGGGKREGRVCGRCRRKRALPRVHSISLPADVEVATASADLEGWMRGGGSWWDSQPWWDSKRYSEPCRR